VAGDRPHLYGTVILMMNHLLNKGIITVCICAVCFTACDRADPSDYIANAHLYGARVAKVRSKVRDSLNYETNETAMAWRMFTGMFHVKEDIGVSWNKQAKQWEVTAGGTALLHGRYFLVFVSEIRAMQDGDVAHVSDPQLHVQELALIMQLTDGRHEVRYTGNDALLSGSKVREAMSNHFRIPDIGFPIVTNRPLANSEVLER